MIKVRTPSKIISCTHCHGAFTELVEKENEAPLLRFWKFPPDGCVWISRETVIICCAGCRGMAEMAIRGELISRAGSLEVTS